jgi:dynein heavy chain
MGHPGGGRTAISRRTLHKFHILNMTFPERSQLVRIFGTLIHSHLQAFDEDIKPAGDMMTTATIEVYQRLSTELLPTPDKPHYTFNLRDISRVFQGVLQSTKDYFDTRDAMIRLWAHECLRVFCDRLTTPADREYFHGLIGANVTATFQTTMKALYKDGEGEFAPFGDFMRTAPDGKAPPYEELADPKALKRFMEERLDDYNVEPGVQAMDLVMFGDAIGNVCRIKRVLGMPRGHAMLVGVGGSGRQSLSKLASYIAGYKVFQVEVVKGYRSELFREDLKKLYERTGLNGENTTFVFNDTQVIEVRARARAIAPRRTCGGRRALTPRRVCCARCHLNHAPSGLLRPLSSPRLGLSVTRRRLVQPSPHARMPRLDPL